MHPPSKNQDPPHNGEASPGAHFILHSPRRVLLIITVSIFACEAIVTLLLSRLPPQLTVIAAALDASLLIILLSPILYFFLFRPVVAHLHMRQRAEEALKRSQAEQLKTVLSTSRDGFWINDETGRFLEVNETYCRMIGYSRAELLGMGISDVEAVETPEVTAAHLKELFEAGNLFFETRHRRKDGVILDMEISATFSRQQGIKVYSFIRNITERKQAEELLRLQSEITANSAEGISLIRAADGVITYVNRRFEIMFGYADGELLGKPMATVHADAEGHSQKMEAEIMQALETQGVWQGEVLNKRKDGTTFWSSTKVSMLPHPQQGTLLLGYHSDITARKQAEESLKLASMVYESSSEAIAVSDARNRIIAVNPMFEKMTGYTVDEILGKNPSFMTSGRHDQAFYQQMWQEIISTGHWHGEMWDKRKNGEIYAKSLSINTIKNHDGSVHRYVALFSDITERKQSEELIWKQANFDTLTALPNRNMFLDCLQDEVKKADRSKLPVALLLIDLDQFKEVNDTLGHAVGDSLLKEAATRISSCVRNSDTVARLGGDEFAVILPGISDIADIEEITQKIIGKLAEYFSIGHEAVYISASVGITLYPNDASNIEDLMKNADQAMYAAKKNGRNRCSYFTHSLQENAQKRLRLINDLRSALPDNQLRVYFQPIVDLLTRRIYKAEALIRWQHPERGMVSPMEFIPLAEESGLIHEIGDWVFKEAALWAKRWSVQFFQDFQISVNKSPVQFKGEGNAYSASWIDYLQELEVPGRQIVVEITEGLLLNAESDVTDKLLRFSDAGIQVAIDDFGTGYSSLSYLKKFDIDYLKIDQSFVRNLTTESNDMALCEAIIVMAHKLDLKVIAEGVETELQEKMLAAAGCDYAQGYLLSKPVPPEELEQIMLRRLQ